MKSFLLEEQKKPLEAAGIHPIGISDVTGFPEIMDGRVKTLHPKVHGALLVCSFKPRSCTSITRN